MILSTPGCFYSCGLLYLIALMHQGSFGRILLQLILICSAKFEAYNYGTDCQNTIVLLPGSALRLMRWKRFVIHVYVHAIILPTVLPCLCLSPGPRSTSHSLLTSVEARIRTEPLFFPNFSPMIKHPIAKRLFPWNIILPGYMYIDCCKCFGTCSPIA